jgi:nitrite reductase (NADH) small subunit/3-phenylpropionate/trans-cinnamate dioxygenase ferredoxin subunit
MSVERTFARVASSDEIAPGGALVVNVGRYDVALFNVGGEINAYENACPHQGGPIGEGWIEDGVVTCPWHAWRFDLRSGSMTLGDYAKLRRFDVRVEAGGIFVATEPEAE